MTDSSYALWIISLVGVVFSTIVLSARAIIRWRNLGAEEYILVVAQVLAFGQYGALFTSLHYGLGKSTDILPYNFRTLVSRTAFASQILTVLSLGLSKCSLVLLVRRLFASSVRHDWLICNSLVGVFCVWLVGAVILVSVGCDVSHYTPPNGNETCAAFAARWNLIIALDVISELVLISLPLYFIWSLKIPLTTKLRVVLAFALRLPVAAFVITFSVLFTAVNISSTRGVAVAAALLWQQLELAYSLVSASIPILHFFIGSFPTESNIDTTSSSEYSSTYAARPSHNSPSAKESLVQAAISLHTFRPKVVEESNGGNLQHHVGRLRPERLKSCTTISAGRSRSRDSERSQAGSQDFIIRRDVKFHVESVCAGAFGRQSHASGT